MSRRRFHHRSSHQQNRFNNRNSNKITNSRSSDNSLQSNPIDTSSSSSLARSDEIPKEIPGYYYDHEKNRYFKIMPNKAVGSNNPFSADSIGTKTKRAKEVNHI